MEKKKSLLTAKRLVWTCTSDRERVMPLTRIFLPITFQTAGRYGTGKGPGVIGHGQQQRCGRDEALRLRYELPLHRVATRASPEDRRVEETVVVLWHLSLKTSSPHYYGSQWILETRISRYAFIVSLSSRAFLTLYQQRGTLHSVWQIRRSYITDSWWAF